MQPQSVQHEHVRAFCLCERVNHLKHGEPPMSVLHSRTAMGEYTGTATVAFLCQNPQPLVLIKMYGATNTV